jgi:beta-mannosidase
LLTTTRSLDSGWQVRELPRDGRPDHLILPAIPAQVPGHVHLDLQRAGAIPDPFARMAERGVEWVDMTDWAYETTFQVEALSPGKTYLVFDGLDTIAEISLNGTLIGQTDNMYIAHEFDVTSHLVIGENALSVTFRSANLVGHERLAKWEAEGNPSRPGHWDHWAARSFVRKAQYMFGWDWGPVLRSAGIWRGVRLVSVPTARIAGWRHEVAFGPNDETATVTFEVTIERSGDEPVELGINFYDVTAWGEEVDADVPELVAVKAEPGASSVTATVTIDNPRRWWPNGTEDAKERAPHLYGVEITLFSAADEVDSRDVQIGLRTIELLHEPDADGQGEGFRFRVNGADIFAKGANWIPSDSFPSTYQNDGVYPDDLMAVSDIRIAELVLLARDSGINMLRIWGGGFYESDYFYELCDQSGILVWQDFPYACAFYPDTGEYADAARIEAVAAIRRIRQHASLALWCGNNENFEIFAHKWSTPPPRFLGEHVYLDVLPKAVAAEDPGTAYWPGSPYGGENPSSADFGDRHNWDVWHGRGDWKFYSEDRSRFCSEFGFAASCGLGAWDAVLDQSDMTIHSPAMHWHDKTRRGYDKYLAMVGIHFPEPQSVKDLVYYTQLNQAEALKYGIEHYRRSKGRCWGTLFWQLNDCWPVHSWAVIDSLIEPKAAYHAMKDFYAPVLLSLVPEGDSAQVHLVSDLLEPISGTVTVIAETFAGKKLASQDFAVEALTNASALVGTFDLAALKGHEQDAFVYASFEGEFAPFAENFLFLSEPKEWRLTRPQMGVDVTLSDDGEFEITLAAQAFAPYIWLRLSDNSPLFAMFDDAENFFHMRAGEIRKVRLEARDGLETVEDLRARLVVRTF